MPMNIAACRRSKKYRGAAHVVWLTPARCRNALQYLPIASLVSLQSSRVVGAHVPRSNGTHVHIVLRPFVRERFGPLGNRALGCSIRRNANASFTGEQGGDINDLAS